MVRPSLTVSNAPRTIPAKARTTKTVSALLLGPAFIMGLFTPVYLRTQLVYTIEARFVLYPLGLNNTAMRYPNMIAAIRADDAARKPPVRMPNIPIL